MSQSEQSSPAKAPKPQPDHSQSQGDFPGHRPGQASPSHSRDGYSPEISAEEIHAEAFPGEAPDSSDQPGRSISTEDIVSSGTDDPLSDAEIQQYRKDINKLDRTILDAIKQRTAISQAVGRSRMGSGGTRLVHSREVAIINQFREELGPEGPAIAVALLRMGRGKLG